MRNPSVHNSGKGLHMIVLVSLIVLLRGFPCFHDFSHGAIHHVYNWIIDLLFLIYTDINECDDDPDRCGLGTCENFGGGNFYFCTCIPGTVPNGGMAFDDSLECIGT